MDATQPASQPAVKWLQRAHQNALQDVENAQIAWLHRTVLHTSLSMHAEEENKE